MLRMCRPIFVSGRSVVLDSIFCGAKFITDIKAKSVHAAAMIKNRRYWPKLVTGDYIDTNFEDKEVGDIVMIGARTEDNNLFKLFL